MSHWAEIVQNWFQTHNKQPRLMINMNLNLTMLNINKKKKKSRDDEVSCHAALSTGLFEAMTHTNHTILQLAAKRGGKTIRFGSRLN